MDFQLTAEQKRIVATLDEVGRDEFAPKKAVDWLSLQFSRAKVKRIHYIPPAEDLRSLRHFGFFRSRFKSQLWDMVDQWIKEN